MRKIALAIAACAIAASCGGAVQDSAERSVVGVTQGQVVLNAQSTLLERGYTCTEVDPGQGKLATDWRDRPRRSTRYEIQAAPSEKNPGALTVKVRALARDRNLKGWSAEYGAKGEAEDLVDDLIGAQETTPGAAQETSVSEPTCRRSSECPSGQHCGSGRCVSECTDDGDCGDKEECDGKGRCVPMSTPVVASDLDAADEQPAPKRGKNKKTAE